MQQEEMEKEIQALEDIEAIKNLHNEYIFYLRNQQFEDMTECFADDAVLEIRDFGARVGKKEIAGLFTNHIPNETRIPRGNSLTQPVITVDGDTARGHLLLVHFRCDYTKLQGRDYLSEWEQGYYDSKYKRVNGEWKFSHLRFISPWPEKMGKWEPLVIAD